MPKNSSRATSRKADNSLSEAVDSYLQSLHCELWPAECFYVSQPEDRAKAVSWLAEVIRKIEH